MNIVMLSLDQALLCMHGEGDSLTRFQAYAKKCKRFQVIVPTTQKTYKKRHGLVNIIPAYGVNKFFAYLKTFYLTAIFCLSKQTDLVVTNDAVLGSMALLASAVSATKVQINIFGLNFLYKKQKGLSCYEKILKQIQIWALTHANSIRTDTSFERDYLIKKLHILPEKAFVLPVVPNQQTIHTLISQKSNQKLRKDLLQGKEFLVLAVGRLVPEKDFSLLFLALTKVIEKIPETKLVLAGDGPLKKQLETEIKKLNLGRNVQLLGSLSHKKLLELFANSNLFVLSSYKEGLPRVLMYAGFSSLPIVTTNIPGAYDLFEHQKSALIVEKRNKDQLAEAIVKVLQNQKLALKLGQAAKKETLKKLDFEKAVSTIISSWQNLK